MVRLQICSTINLSINKIQARSGLYTSRIATVKTAIVKRASSK